MKIKLSWRIWLFFIVIALAILSIFGFPPTFLEKGVLVREVAANSTAYQQGLTSGQIIKEINGQTINSVEDYSNAINSIFTLPNESIKLSITTKTGSYVFFTEQIPEIVVSEIPKTKIQTGLDLRGGARAIIKPEITLSEDEMDVLKSMIENRLNVYGITDLSVKIISDLAGEKFLLIEIAGTTPSELNKLIAEQGKFEAKIGNETVFIGGNQDIEYVCRNDANCARIESCTTTDSGDYCSYSFEIRLSEEAAKRHANITKDLGLNITAGGGRYLDKTIDFYVDDKLATSLMISENLKGRETTQVQIQGSGSGTDRKSAIEDSEQSMKRLQTILLTGSLPYKLEIVKLDTISPMLGKDFNKLILLTGLVSLLAVAIIIFAKYRNIKASALIMFTSTSEIIIILGIAALIKWNLDLPSIAGILVAIGTGVDDQIVIVDESSSQIQTSIREKIKSALFIVVAAFLTTFVSLLPLYWAGAGLLQGFAFTTMIGLTIGVLISRPAFADMIRIIKEKNAT
ncbi:MAG: MMPL family transporter [Candidatus Pacearchaeota archaeon]